MKLKNLIPFGVFLGLAVLLATMTNLGNNPNFMPNMIGKKLDNFTLPTTNNETLELNKILTEPVIINVWASWCISCKYEEGILKDLSGKGYKIYGLATADKAENVKKYLAKNGNPYAVVGLDQSREVSIAMGVVGTPETFVVGKDSIVYYHFRGPLNDEEVNKKLIPIIEELKKK